MTRREQIINNKDGIAMLLVREVIRIDGEIVYQAPDGTQSDEFDDAVDAANSWLESEYEE